MRFLAKMAPQHFREIGIAFGGKHRDGMPCRPKKNPSDPHPQTESERRRHRSIDDGQCTWRSSEQDWLGQGAMQRHLEARGHETSAPPPNEKKDKKKLEAAKAMERPRTI